MAKSIEFHSRAKDLAKGHKKIHYSKVVKRDFAGIKSYSMALLKAYRTTNEQLKKKESLIPAAEWLLDNFYMVEEQSKHIQLEMDDSLKDLPLIEAGLPRAYLIADELVFLTDGQVDEDNIREFIEEYQSITPLTTGELWVMPLMLRISLIKAISNLAIHIVDTQDQRKRGYEWGLTLLKNLEGPKGQLQQLIMEHHKTNRQIKASYAEGMMAAFRENGDRGASLVTWLDGRLALQGTDIEELIKSGHQEQAGYQVSIGNAITSLKFLSSIRWEEIFESLSHLEEILWEDPAGVYGNMEFASRDYYRHNLVKIARECRVNELDVAKAAIECALEAKGREGQPDRKRHVGYYLVDRGRAQLISRIGCKDKKKSRLKEHPKTFYFGSIGLLVFIGMALILSYLYRFDENGGTAPLVISGFICLVPLVTLAVGLIHWIIPRIIPPHYLPKLELKDGIPEEYRTIVAIPTLLSGVDRVRDLIEQMEVFYLANQEKNIHFALVGDFKDSKNQEEPEDRTIIETASNAIMELNKRYDRNGGDIFFFFHRHRQWNPIQKSWMGWDRKRGALVEFVSLLRGKTDTSFSTKVGDLSILSKVKYVITLDADTNLPRDAAKRLVGTLAHPLNQPLVNKTSGRVTEGYGLLQPRIGVAVDSAGRSSFALTFSGQTGVDPYTTAVSDVYQDLFHEGIFTGKGIFHVDVFNDILTDAIPENSVLSHDLLEGSYIRAGLVTDIELIDGYPANYIAYAMRLHRWVRGDWQLLPWLFPYVRDRRNDRVKNPLTAISKWKIYDNMRRSLLSPSLFLLLALGLTVLPGSHWFWLGLFAITLALPLLMDVVASFIGGIKTQRQSLGDIMHGTKNLAMQIILTFVFLPHQAYLMVDAITRTIIRVTITRRNLLEWVTAADTERKFKGTLDDYRRKMLPAMLVSIGFFIWVALFQSSSIAIPFAISVIWLLSPFIAYKVSLPKHRVIPELSKEQIFKLRTISRRTWKYFEEFINEENNWLPPDNYQEEPYLGTANRTSPTNIGISLAATLSAKDLGYICTLETIQRLERTIKTLMDMDMWKGHLYNWYDIRTLEPLKPRYVSSVDSGNLACYLILVRQGIEELLSRPLVGKNAVLGVKDTINLDLGEDNERFPPLINMMEVAEKLSLTEWRLTLNQLGSIGQNTDRLVSEFQKEMDEIVPWVDLLLDPPKEFLEDNGLSSETKENFNRLMESLDEDFSLKKIIEDYHSILDSLSKVMLALRKGGESGKESKRIAKWLKELEIAMGESHMAARKISTRCQKLAGRIDSIFKDMDFTVLYDSKKELFSIGYDVESDELQDVYYDLLASEARQTSFIAIAKGEIPQKHWFKLARSLTLVGDSRGLLSWGGTMFEYLMPLLIMKNYNNTLWDETYHTVIKGQKQYGDQRHVPWGVSESAFYAFDLQLNYQYKAFGVPKLGLKTGLINDIVVSPYATIMGLAIAPLAAMRNIEHLMAEGMGGEYGMYEALDYTPERVPHRKKHMLVKTYMVHHQGMIFLALNNFLNDNIMQGRFHSIPMVKATELLLQEKIPQREIIIQSHGQDYEMGEIEIEKKSFQEIHAKHVIDTPHTPIPEVWTLSNNNYSLLITNSGGGYSRLNGLYINRWREDTTMDNWGMFFYIKNLNSGHYWSSGYQPSLDEGQSYEVHFEPEKVVFIRRDGNIETKTEIVVSPEHNVEIRRLLITNHSENNRVIEVTSYFEPILTSLEGDMAHPAFSNLFIETDFVEDRGILLINRRTRNVKREEDLWLANALLVEGNTLGGIQYETDRAKFIGRNRNLKSPKAMDEDQPLSNTTGAVLDPVMSMRQRLSIEPGESAKLSYILATANSRSEVISLAKEYQNGAIIARAFELAWTHSQVEMRYLNISAMETKLYHRMLSSLIYPNPHFRARSIGDARNVLGQSGLWKYGISGVLPIVMLSLEAMEQMEMARQMISVHEYWMIKGIRVDLVIINEYGNSYEQPIEERLLDMVTLSHLRELKDRPGGVFIIQGNQLSKDDRALLAYSARIYIQGNRGSVASQVDSLINDDMVSIGEPFVKKTENNGEESYSLQDYSLKENSEGALLFFNDIGGFTSDGLEYEIRLHDHLTTPLPWSNIVAGEDFGFLVTESGGGYTWYGNSRENKLTPWNNDAIQDPPGEIIYLRDEDTGRFWSITPSPIRGEGLYTINHGQGYTSFGYRGYGLIQRQTLFMDPHNPIKYYQIDIGNDTHIPRRLSLIFYVQWVCGADITPNNQYIVSRTEGNGRGLLVKNPYNEEYGERVAFIAADRPYMGVTAHRGDFIGRNGSLKEPVALMHQKLSGRVGAGLDPCGAIQVFMEIEPYETQTMVFALGQGKDEMDARRLIVEHVTREAAAESLEASKNQWNTRLGAIRVKTPDRSTDIMVNRWLLYQTMSSRIMGRTGFYQAGGAYGFRDQLQDVLALIYSDRDRMKDQILLSSIHQFLEGDVQHWWHPPKRGIRTRITDDLLFLPYVTANYIQGTGDFSILDEETHYLVDDPLREGEDERYDIPHTSEIKEDIYSHCIKAIEKSLAFGDHGLPLIGGGDWNDGMDNIGPEGKGESVWLGWFLYRVLKDFIPICNRRGDSSRADRYGQIAEELKRNIEKEGWDGGWYRRAYFDDGRPLGSEENEECRIDAISQSWAVISEASKPYRAKIAMESMEKHLVEKEEGLIRLLAPPFYRSSLEPGYIKGYVPGVRENGGQYTHAAVWTVLANAMLGDGNKAWQLFHMINPINHGRTWIEINKYKVEPYVMAADVYAVEPHVGRGGWTWYTGSSAWMYRVGVEWILGLKLRDGKLYIDPCIPDHWDEYEIQYTFGNGVYNIKILNPEGVNSGIKELKLDGVIIEDKAINLSGESNNHSIVVIMGKIEQELPNMLE